MRKNNFTLKKIFVLSFLLLLISNCFNQKSNNNLINIFRLHFIDYQDSKINVIGKKPVVVNEKLTGVTQKGPFVKGSKVTLTELNDDLTKTSKIYHTETKDDTGSFDFNEKFTKDMF